MGSECSCGSLDQDSAEYAPSVSWGPAQLQRLVDPQRACCRTVQSGTDLALPASSTAAEHRQRVEQQMWVAVRYLQKLAELYIADMRA